VNQSPACEPVVDKWKPSAFKGTNSHELVPEGSDVKLALVGLQSDCCVQATNTSALKRGTRCPSCAVAMALWDDGDRVEGEIERGLEKAGGTIIDATQGGCL
jgi:nicotinamidase-related amidase